MIRSLCLASLTLLTLWALGAIPTLAEATPDAARSNPILLTAMAGVQVEVPADHLVVFRNDAPGTARVIFRRGDVARVDCQEGRGVERSRSGQYTVQAGSDLLCNLEPGSYRYETLTHHDGGITRTKSRLSVR